MSLPNLILMAAHQHRLDCTGYAGHPDVRTPNLDALARGGAWFAAAESAGSTAQASLRGLVGLETVSGLQEAGYHTGYAGPPCVFAELAARARTAPLPGQAVTATDYGAWLDEQGLIDRSTAWAGQEACAAPSSYRAHFGAMRSSLPEAAHVTTWLGDQAVALVRAAIEPFCLVVCFTRPGEPYDPPGMREADYTQRGLCLPADCRLPVMPGDAEGCPRFDFRAMSAARMRRVLACYYASITLVDHQAGRILGTLQARGFTRTLIAYTALGGELAGHRGLVGAGEPGLHPIVRRVPLLVAGAPGLEPGRHDRRLDTQGLLGRLLATAARGKWEA